MVFNIHFSVCLLRCFFSDAILFWLLSVVSFNFSATSLSWFMQHILKAIWKSRHWHLSVSIETAKFYFSLTNFFWKKKHLWTMQILCLIIWYQVSLCYNPFLYSVFFHAFRSIHWCSRKKVAWSFGASIH